ncbi:MAG: hypothetical protein ABGY75_09240 [Gemmataceae bacterium]
MTRLTPLVALLAVAPLSAAPVPKAAAKNYFPLQVGHKWEYVTPDGKLAHIAEVTTKEEKGGATFYTLSYSRGERKLTEVIYRVDKDGVGFMRAGMLEYDPPMVVVNQQLTAGARWTGKSQFDRRELEYEMEVGPAEEVKTPAGTFTALPVRQKYATIRQEHVSWYADGVGLVKSSAGGGISVNELKSFTPAKEGKK